MMFPLLHDIYHPLGLKTVLECTRTMFLVLQIWNTTNPSYQIIWCAMNYHALD